MTSSITTPTLTHVAEPRDKRCTWVQKRATPEQVLGASLDAIDSGYDLPGVKLRYGNDVELNAYDVLFDIEERHHVKRRGYDYLVGIVFPCPTGLELRWYELDITKSKERIKAADDTLKAGSGPNAAMVRVAKFVLRVAGDAERAERWALLTA